MSLLNLNVQTLLFFLFLGNLMTSIFFAAYNLESQKKPSFFDRLFFVGKLSQTLAWLLIMLRGTVPPIISLVLGNLLLVIGLAEEGFALLTLTKIKILRWKRLFISITFVTAIFCLEMTNQESYTPYLGLISSSHALLFLLVGGAFLFVPKHQSRLTTLMGSLYTILSIGLFLRAISLFQSGSEYGLFKSDPRQIMAMVFLFITMSIGNLGYSLVKKADSDREILHMATHDPLTNCLNKAAFEEAFSKFNSLCRRQKQILSLIILDIDHFKAINDTHGHLEGDRILKELVQVAESNLRSYDVIGRYGGEEFTILLPSTDLHQAGIVAERIRGEVEKYFLSSPNPIKLTISLGVACCHPCKDRISFEELLKLSDDALYRAKRNGRNRVVTLPSTCQ